jgi:hypothetical protein
MSFEPRTSNRVLVLCDGFLRELKLVLVIGEPFLGELKLVLEVVDGFLKELKLVLVIVEFFCLLDQQLWYHSNGLVFLHNRRCFLDALKGIIFCMCPTKNSEACCEVALLLLVVI